MAGLDRQFAARRRLPLSLEAPHDMAQWKIVATVSRESPLVCVRVSVSVSVSAVVLVVFLIVLAAAAKMHANFSWRLCLAWATELEREAGCLIEGYTKILHQNSGSAIGSPRC
eukprot:1050747-Amphidinium_carterae.1